MRSEDLVPLLAAAPPSAVGFRQGRIVAWDPITAANTVDVAGATLTDVPILNTAEAAILTPGDVVGLLTTGTGAQSWWILGRVTVPGTPAATSAYSALFARIRAANNSTPLQLTTAVSTSYATATSISASAGECEVTDVVIGNSGACLAIISANITTSPSNVANSGSASGWVGVDVAGPTNLAAQDGRALDTGSSWGAQAATSILTAADASTSRVEYIPGLSPGRYTFSLRYRVLTTASVQVSWFNRSIVIIPL